MSSTKITNRLNIELFLEDIGVRLSPGGHVYHPTKSVEMSNDVKRHRNWIELSAAPQLAHVATPGPLNGPQASLSDETEPSPPAAEETHSDEPVIGDESASTEGSSDQNDSEPSVEGEPQGEPSVEATEAALEPAPSEALATDTVTEEPVAEVEPADNAEVEPVDEAEALADGEDDVEETEETPETPAGEGSKPLTAAEKKAAKRAAAKEAAAKAKTGK